MKKRIRIFFINCPTLDTDALSYLLLAQNKVQDIFQFEIYHYWIYSLKSTKIKKSFADKFFLWHDNHPNFPFPKWIDRRVRSAIDRKAAPFITNVIKQNEWFNEIKSTLSGYDFWAKSSTSQYDAHECPSIVITETPIEGGFISFADGPYGLISAANWRAYFKPVSALEYLLFSVQRLSLRMGYSNKLRSHYPTRGCVWDYHDHQPDSRNSTLIGYVCETCDGILATEAHGQHHAIKEWIKNDWIYDKDNASSPASVLSKTYKYDLIKTKGLSSNFLTRVYNVFESELGKILSEGLKWLLVAIGLLFLTSKFPSLLSAIKSLKCQMP